MPRLTMRFYSIAHKRKNRLSEQKCHLVRVQATHKREPQAKLWISHIPTPLFRFWMASNKTNAFLYTFGHTHKGEKRL